MVQGDFVARLEVFQPGEVLGPFQATGDGGPAQAVGRPPTTTCARSPRIARSTSPGRASRPVSGSVGAPPPSAARGVLARGVPARLCLAAPPDGWAAGRDPTRTPCPPGTWCCARSRTWPCVRATLPTGRSPAAREPTGHAHPDSMSVSAAAVNAKPAERPPCRCEVSLPTSRPCGWPGQAAAPLALRLCRC